MSKVRNSLNYATDHYPFIKGEVNVGPSMTVPDQTLSIQEILDRFARGLPVSGGRAPIFDEEDELPDLRTLDLAERQELKERYTAELDQIKANSKKPVKQAEKPISGETAGSDPA